MVEKTFLFQGKTLFMPAGFFIEDSFKYGEGFTIPPLGNIPSIRIIDAPADVTVGESFVDVRTAISLVNEAEVEAIFRAFHIVQWRRESIFCGRCGHKNIDVEQGITQEVIRVCPNCDRVEFPRICPAVIVLITDGEDRILLAHNRKFRPEVFSLIAGFNEVGETLEETVAREVLEEIGVLVKDIRYAASQAWPFPNALMIGWTASYASGSVKPDGVEIEKARWFDRDRLPELPAKGSIARKLIDRWRNGVYL